MTKEGFSFAMLDGLQDKEEHVRIHMETLLHEKWFSRRRYHQDWSVYETGWFHDNN